MFQSLQDSVNFKLVAEPCNDRAMMLRLLFFTTMGSIIDGPRIAIADGVGQPRAAHPVVDADSVSPSRSLTGKPLDARVVIGIQSKAFITTSPTRTFRVRALTGSLMVGTVLAVVLYMFQPPPQQGGHANNLRLPPRWEPSMEGSLPFRTWVQDLMLWTICTDLAPAQQCAAIISQLGGAARELARTLSPNEVYNGGLVNGVQLDPVSFLLHGLQTRFAPLDEENRLRAAQDLLTFSRRQGESVDTLISRFEIVRQRARDEGGGAVSLETASLLLLRACGVSSEQFQTLTQPFGFRLPANDMEFHQLGHHLRRMGHIVERSPNNLASGLRQHAHFSQSFMTEADTGSSATVDSWQDLASAAPWSAAPSANPVDWAFASNTAGADGSDTDSATSSDNDDEMLVDDLQGLSPKAMDEYLFGQYQQAKRRWRRFTGKPVRALRRVLRGYINIDEALQQSAYFKGKGKGGKSSGKGFGRKTNPCGRDGEPLRCSICGSSYHLRARCPRRTEGNQTSSGGVHAPAQATGTGPSFTVQSAGLHFAAFESDSSWAQVLTPRSVASTFRTEHAPAGRVTETVSAEGIPSEEIFAPSAPPAVHHLQSPDPWVTNADPWMEWYQEAPNRTARPVQAPQVQALVPQGPQVALVPPRSQVPQAAGPAAAGAQVPDTWTVEPPPPVPMHLRAPGAVPGWFSASQQGMAVIQEQNAQRSQERRNSGSYPVQASLPYGYILLSLTCHHLAAGPSTVKRAKRFFWVFAFLV